MTEEMWKERQFTLVAVVVLPLLSASYAGTAYWSDVPSSTKLLDIADLLWFLALALWVVADSDKRPDIYRPYEYGFLVYVYVVAYVPYYLVRTRRWKGALLVGGLYVLYQLPWLTEWAIYFAS